MFCDLIAVPLDSMRADRTSWLDIVDDRSGDGADEGIGAMVGFALAFRGSEQAGRFTPVLRYLARRAFAQGGDRSVPMPTLTPKVRMNAREVDAAIAAGACS